MKSVLFCPYTARGELARRLRKEEETLEGLTGYRVKVVEQVGDKLLDRLHTSNPWRGAHCGRMDCWPCETKAWTEQDAKKDCSKRSLVYETWCQTCFEKEKEAIEQDVEDEQEKKRQIEMIRKHKYVGETARSAYERGWEHQEGLRKLEEDSHLLKHVAQYHQGVPMKEIRFGMKVRRYARSAFERQVLESVLIQEERKSHLLMNSKSEYNRCSLPRLTTRIGNKEYDKEMKRDQQEERMMDMMVRGEIGRRRKERCQMRRQEIHPTELEESENTPHKRRKVNDDWEYKKVMKMKKPERMDEKDDQEEGKAPKKRKVEEEPRRKFLGMVMKGYELEDPIDWDEERRKRQEEMDKEEQERQARIRKAKRLEDSWKLVNLCREYIKENSQTWRDRDDEREQEMSDLMRKERTQVARYKKDRFTRNHLRKEKTQKITNMLRELPVGEQEKWRKDQRLLEGRSLKEMKDNMWKKWRGEPKGKERKVEIPQDDDKLDEKLRELERRIVEYRQEQKKTEKRMIKRKKLEDHWKMMRWLVKFIEENRYTWERRRQIEKEEWEMNDVYEQWLAKDRDSQIEEMRSRRQKAVDTEMMKMQRQQKAKIRKKMWKEWRKPEDSGTRTLPRGDVREPPGHDSSPHNTGEIPEKLGGDDPGWGGAYQELQLESTAPCNTGPHIHLEPLEPDESKHEEIITQEDELRGEVEREGRKDDDERIKMEIMLGMTQEEGIPCLLCLMPRCICHLSLELAKLETKLLKLRNLDKEKEVKQEMEDPASKDEEEGNLGGLLEGGGLTLSGEGSPSPQEPAGDLDSKPDEQPKPAEIQTSELMHKMQDMMRKAEKQEDEEKSRKAVTLKKKLEVRKKLDKQEAKNSRNIKQMMLKWKEMGESGTGKSPTKLEYVRNSVGRKNADMSGTSEGEEGRTKKYKEVRKSLPSTPAHTTIGKQTITNLVRKKETAVKNEEEKELQAGKVVVAEEEGTSSKEANTARKQEEPNTVINTSKGRFKNLDNLVRKPPNVGIEEERKEVIKLRVRNQDQKLEEQEHCQDGVSKPGGSEVKGRRSRIADIIRNFNEINSKCEGEDEGLARNRNKVEKVMVEEVRSRGSKRKASVVLEETVNSSSSSKKSRPLASAARKSSSTRDKPILKYLTKINLLNSKESTGDILDPVQTAGQGGEGVQRSQGVGEVIQLETTPDALAKSDVNQLHR